MECFDKAVQIGSPVNPPIWWIAPNDKIAQSIDDEFLLGEKILTAPVIVKGSQTKLQFQVNMNKIINSVFFCRRGKA